jgi:hypothetical protein
MVTYRSTPPSDRASMLSPPNIASIPVGKPTIELLDDVDGHLEMLVVTNLRNDF